jgi:hypothetical protein
VSVTPIIDIEVRDEKVRAAIALFEKLQKVQASTSQAFTPAAGLNGAPGQAGPAPHIPSQPAPWQTTASGAEQDQPSPWQGAAGSAREGGMGMGAPPARIRSPGVNPPRPPGDDADFVGMGGKFDAALAHSARTMKDIAHSAHSLATDIAEVTKSLLRWGGIGIGASLLGLGGGLFGLEALGRSAGGALTRAQGLGTTAGRQQAFGLAFQRYGDANGLLNNVESTRTDLASKWVFSNLGITDTDTADTSDLGAEVSTKIAAIMRANPNMTQQQYSSMGYDKLVPMSTARTLGQAPAGDINRQFGSQYQSDAKAFAVDPGIARAWQNLEQQIGKAGQSIETAFIKGLVPLAPAFGKISEALTNLVTGALANPDLKIWIHDLADGIEHLGTYLDSSKFQSDVQRFLTGIGDFVTGLGNANNALKTLGFEKDDRKTGYHVDWSNGNGDVKVTNNDPNTPLPWWLDTGTHEIERAAGGAWRGIKGWLQSPLPDLGAPVLGSAPKGVSAAQIAAWQKSAIVLPKATALAREDQEAAAQNVPVGFARAIFGLEGGLNDDGTPRTSGAGAIGAGQLMPKTALGLGVNPYDSADNIRGGVAYQSQMLNAFGGDPDKAAAAYNWGPAALQRDIDKWGKDWRNHLPAETAKYVAGLDARMAANDEKSVISQLSPSSSRDDTKAIVASAMGAKDEPKAGDSGPHGGGSALSAHIASLAKSAKMMAMSGGGSPSVTIRNQTGSDVQTITRAVSTGQ